MSWLPFVILLPLLPAGPPESGHGLEGGEAADSGQAATPVSRAPVLTVDLTVASAYVWRGELQYASPVAPSFQPSIALDFDPLIAGSLEVSIWTAFAMTDRERSRQMGTANEVDFAVVYTNSVARDWLELSGGFFYYTFPGSDQVDGAKEIMLGMSLGNLPVSLGVTTFLEVHPGLGLVVEPTLGWEAGFGAFTVGVSAVVGASFVRDEDPSLDHATVTALVSHEVGRLTLGFSLSYTLRIAPPGLDFLDRSLLWGAVCFGVTR